MTRFAAFLLVLLFHTTLHAESQSQASINCSSHHDLLQLQKIAVDIINKNGTKNLQIIGLEPRLSSKGKSSIENNHAYYIIESRSDGNLVHLLTYTEETKICTAFFSLSTNDYGDATAFNDLVSSVIKTFSESMNNKK